MDWIQVATIIGSLGGFMFYMLNRIDSDVKSACDRIDKMGVRLDNHAGRIDQLYHIIIDLIKEGRK